MALENKGSRNGLDQTFNKLLYMRIICNRRGLFGLVLFVISLLGLLACKVKDVQKYNEQMKATYCVYKISNSESDTLRFPMLTFKNTDICSHIEIHTISDTLIATVDVNAKSYGKISDGELLIDGELNVYEIGVPHQAYAYFYFPKCQDILNNEICKLLIFKKILRIIIGKKIYNIPCSTMVLEE